MELNKVTGPVAFLIAFTGAVVGFNSYFAKAADLEKKADAEVVRQLQEQILLDRKDEIEEEIFILEGQDELSELDLFRLKKLRSRLEDIDNALE